MPAVKVFTVAGQAMAALREPDPTPSSLLVVVQENLGQAVGINAGIAAPSDESTYVWEINADNGLAATRTGSWAVAVEERDIGIALPELAVLFNIQQRPASILERCWYISLHPLFRKASLLASIQKS